MAPGETFIDEGQPADCFFNITAGSAKLFKVLPDGRRQIVGLVGVGHFLGIAVSDTYAFSAEAIGPVRYCRFSRTRLRALLGRLPADGAAPARGRRERAGCGAGADAAARPQDRARAAGLLPVAAKPPGLPCGHSRHRFTLPMPRSDIADYLGLTIETVSRTLTRLKADKLIILPSPAEVQVLNRTKLEALAGGYEE